MNRRREVLNQLFAETKAIEAQLDLLNMEMSKNDPALVEELQKKIEKRADTLARLGEFLEGQAVSWSEEELVLIREMQETEQKLQQGMQSLYESFTRQMYRLKQGQQASQKYGQGSWAYSDGAFFDKRH
jgi:hypothetical protein